MKFLIDLSSNNNYLIKNVLQKPYIFKPLLDYLPNVVHVCDIIQISKWKKILGMKRKAPGPDMCDQSRFVINVRTTEHKSRDKWFSNWDVTFPWLQKELFVFGVKIKKRTVPRVLQVHL